MRGLFHGRSAGQHEPGIALPAAIIIMVIAAIIVVAISMATMGARDRATDARERAQATGPADEGIAAYTRSLTANAIGEHTGFSFTQDALAAYVASQGGSATCASETTKLCLMPNAQTAFKTVDPQVPAADRVTIRRLVGSGVSRSYRYWQILAIGPPQYGITAGGTKLSPGAEVVVYVRGWTGNSTGGITSTRPVISRAEIRPPRMSDFQALINGKINYAAGSTVNGRVHSNGFNESLFNAMSSMANITLQDGVTCTGSARFSVPRNGTIDVNSNAGCGGSKINTESTEQTSLLTANEAIDAMRRTCAAQPNQPPLRVVCVTNAAGAAGVYRVNLGSNGVITGTGIPAVDARVGGGNYGAAIVFDRTVHVSGVLGSNARATIVAAAGAAGGGLETPAIRIDQTAAGVAVHQVGARLADPTSSVGFIADGDVVASEQAACPLRMRAALIAQSGMLSMEPVNRINVTAQPGCDGLFAFSGSIASNLSPYMAAGDAGYDTRKYEWDDMLYDNPPPMWPMAGSWQTRSAALANLDCFQQGANGAIALKRTGTIDPVCV